MRTPAKWKWKGSLTMPPTMLYCILRVASLLMIISQIAPVSGSTYDEDEWTNWSDWSPCSRTCDGGITQQFRRCKSPHGCHGVSIRRKMCNMQPCSEPRDYRNEQCRSFNGKEYRGKRYTWEAIEDPDNPCALICRAEGTDLIAKLSPKLRDGTRCRIGSLHVCVDGRCEAVGCDLKLGSPKKVDECGICGGDGSKCTSPIYTWQMLPTGPCTLNCGGGKQPVKVVCRNSLTSEVVDHFLCNSASKPHRTSQSCNIHPCEPGWQAGEWSLCSVTCGGGLRIRKVYCAQEKNGTKIQVADKLCSHIRKPSNQEPCNMDTCPYWHAGPWSLCSVSCGKGYKTRNVVCRDAMNLPSSACDPELKPADTKACTDQPVCPSLTIATTTSTTTSTTTLAPTALVISRTGPTKKRRVKTTPPEPPSTTTEEEEEEKNKNFMESYSSQFPDSYPTDYDSEAYFGEELPREHTLPLVQPYPPMDNAIPSEPSSKVRVYFACGWLFLSFVAEEWGPCSQTCGEGIRTREVKCKIFLEFSRTIANLPDKECPGPKPPESESCFSNPCSASQDKDMEAFEKLTDSQQALQAEPDLSSLTSNYRNKGIAVGLPPGISMQDMTFSWKVVGYTPCSTSCLGGIQEAMIQCVRDYDQRMATPVLCMDKAQPDIATTRTCNDHPCPPRWNVSDFGPCSKPCGGGVMIREVNCIHEVTRGNTVIVPNSICPQPAPKTERLCNAVHCPPYWEPGDWSRCSKPCGGGERTRALYCKQTTSLGQIIDLSNGERHCPQNKPIETRACNQKQCAPRKGGKQSPSPNDSLPESLGSIVGRSHAYMQQEWKKRLSITARGHATIYNGILLKLRCPTGKGVDRQRLVWMKGHDYVNIQPHKLEVLDKHGILKIKNTTFSDSGIYTCLYNGRPVSNITLMVRPYTGSTELDASRGGRPTHGDKRPRERGGSLDTTFADQQLAWPLAPLLRNNKNQEQNSLENTAGNLATLALDSELGQIENYAGESLNTEGNSRDIVSSRIPLTSFESKSSGLSSEERSSAHSTSRSNAVDSLYEKEEITTRADDINVKRDNERRRKEEKEEDGEETLEEMIGTKTKVFTSTIISPLGDTFSTTFRGMDGSSNSNPAAAVSRSTPTSITASDPFIYEFGLDLVTESTDSAQVFMPTHASLSSTSTTTSTSQAVDYYDAVETTTRTGIIEETTIGQHQQGSTSSGDGDGGLSKMEIVEPFLLECFNSVEEGSEAVDTTRQSGTAGHRHHHHHPRRHGHHHNSNYNRYRSNRRRRRWRNNHNGTSNVDHLNDDNDTSFPFKPNDGKRSSAISCSTATTASHRGDNHVQIEKPDGKQYHYHPQKRGVWKVGNWTLCDTKECFTWNTALRHRQIWCEFRNGSNAVASICDSAIRPMDSEECYNPECRGLWQTEKWSQCTSRCEEVGFKTRILKCVWQGSYKPAGHACHSLTRPLVKKSCRGQPCQNDGVISASASSDTMSLLHPSSPFSSSQEDRSYHHPHTSSSNNNKDKIRSKINSNFYDSSILVTSTSNTENNSPKLAYNNRRRLISEQSLRSRLSMLDRNTLLEEFLRFFHFYYSDHNQNVDNHEYRSQLENKKGGLGSSNNNNSNENYHNNNAARSAWHSQSSSGSTTTIMGHNNNINNKFSLESDDEEIGDY